MWDAVYDSDSSESSSHSGGDDDDKAETSTRNDRLTQLRVSIPIDEYERSSALTASLIDAHSKNSIISPVRMTAHARSGQKDVKDELLCTSPPYQRSRIAGGQICDSTRVADLPAGTIIDVRFTLPLAALVKAHITTLVLHLAFISWSSH